MRVHRSIYVHRASLFNSHCAPAATEFLLGGDPPSYKLDEQVSGPQRSPSPRGPGRVAGSIKSSSTGNLWSPARGAASQRSSLEASLDSQLSAVAAGVSHSCGYAWRDDGSEEDEPGGMDVREEEIAEDREDPTLSAAEKR